jgi:hypothetical protein
MFPWNRNTSWQYSFVLLVVGSNVANPWGSGSPGCGISSRQIVVCYGTSVYSGTRSATEPTAETGRKVQGGGRMVMVRISSSEGGKLRPGGRKFEFSRY